FRSYRGVSVPTACPPGSYCPPGTEDAMQNLCPPGTYSNKTSLQNETQCTPCDPGMCCTGQGNTEPLQQCSPGHRCILGAETCTPTDGVTGDICPEGLFCPMGSVTGEGCPLG
ncbi:unnamed protein product, partial [Owenia fusiformis]